MKLKVSLSNSFHYKEYAIERVEKLLHMRYLSHLEFSNWKVESFVKKRCNAAKKKGKIGELALWLGQLHGKDIEQAKIPDIGVRWIGEKIGYGVFATKSLKKWQYIGEYTGTLRQRRLFFPNINDYCFMYPNEWISLKALTIDSQTSGNYTRYINHNDSPNCESVAVYHSGIFHIIFRTIEEIPEGQQLTYDYGDVYWNRRKKLTEEKIEDLIAADDYSRLNLK